MSGDEGFVYSSKNAFSSGELTPTMEGRSDLPIYQHGVKKLINFMILPSGGIKRRHGTQYIHHFDERIPPARCMLNMMYSRAFSFLVIFTATKNAATEAKETKIEVLINGEGKPILLDNVEIELKTSKFSYTSYQGMAYISFGLEYPIYQFSTDPEQVKKLDTLEEWGSEDRKKLFICEVFKTKGKAYSSGDQSQNQLYRNLVNQEADDINQALRDAGKDDITKLQTSSISVFEGRLWALGTGRNIHEIWASSLGSMDEFNLAYESLLEARNPLSAFSATFISSTFDKILWSLPFAKELLIGSTDGIYILKTGDRTKDEFVAINKDVTMSISKVEPVICGKTIFFVEGDNKQIHSLYYSQEKGGYQISCITNYAEHLFASGIKQIVAVNSPFNIIFAIMNNGSFASFTYSQDLKIMGWAQHWLGGDGKILEAVVLSNKNSESIYFRVIREGKIGGAKTKEYIERFDCKYLTASTAQEPHSPLYADCYMHDLSEQQEEINADFNKIIEAGSSFDFKGDISKLDELIERQVELEGTFDLSNIRDHFFLGGSPINTLEDPDGDSEVLRQVWIEFIEEFYTTYRKTILLSFGLWIAVIRKISAFCALLLKTLLSNQPDFSELDSAIKEIEYILAKFQETKDEIGDWEINQIILASTKKITHVTDGRYSFFPNIMDSVMANNYRIRFNDLVGKLKLAREIAVCFICYPDERRKKAKKQLLKEFVLKASSNWLSVNANESVENLDFDELAFKLANSNDKNTERLNKFQKESLIFTLQNTILDILTEDSFKHFCIRFRPDQVLVDIEGDHYTQETLDKFFISQITRIIAIIYDSYDLGNIGDEEIELIKETITTSLEGFLKICLVVPQEIREEVDIKSSTTLVFYYYLNNDEEILRLVNEQRIKWRAKSISLSFKSDADNAEKIQKHPIDLQEELQRLNDISQYEVAISMLGLDQPREDDDEDIEFDEVDEYDYLSNKVKNAVREKAKLFNEEGEINEEAFRRLDGAIELNNIRLNLDDFIYSGLEKYIDELSDPSINPDLLNDFRQIKEELERNSPALSDMNEFFNISYAQINLTYRDIQDHYITLIRYANLTVPTENAEFFKNWQDQVNPSKIDKFLFLAKEYFPIFRQNFPDIDANMLKVITREMTAAKKSIVNQAMYGVYHGMEASFVGDDELIKSKIISTNPANILTESFKDHYRFISVGFNYKSVLQTFPMIFPEESEHVMKKDAGLHLKLFNTKGGYIEEKVSNTQTQKQFIHTSKVDFDIINNYLPDKKYLMSDSINSIKTPYLSGWLHFTCNRPIEKDIDLVYVVDKPYPATILKIDAKAKLFPNYLK